MLLGEKLKILRKSNEINQIDIAKHLGIATSTYSQYENNIRKPNFEILKKLADYLKCSYDLLLDDNYLTVDDSDIMDFDDFLRTFNKRIITIYKLFYNLENFKLSNDKTLDKMTYDYYMKSLSDMIENWDLNTLYMEEFILEDKLLSKLKKFEDKKKDIFK